MTNIKELNAQNERLRLELSKALMNDTKIIETLDKDGMLEEDGRSFYDTDTHRTFSGKNLLNHIGFNKDLI